MTVAAGVNIYPACRCTLEIVRLYQRRASKIRERRLEHSPMANGDQILKSAFVRIFNQCDDVALFALPENDLPVRQARAFLAQRFAGLIALFFGEKRYFCHVTLFV